MRIKLRGIGSRRGELQSLYVQREGAFVSLDERNKTKQRPPDVCAQEMGIEETVAAFYGESLP